MPLRHSVSGMSRNFRRSGLGQAGGAHGTGARTRARTLWSESRRRRRVSTKIPCAGCSALGNNVVAVRMEILGDGSGIFFESPALGAFHLGDGPAPPAVSCRK